MPKIRAMMLPRMALFRGCDAGRMGCPLGSHQRRVSLILLLVVVVVMAVVSVPCAAAHAKLKLRELKDLENGSDLVEDATLMAALPKQEPIEMDMPGAPSEFEPPSTNVLLRANKKVVGVVSPAEDSSSSSKKRAALTHDRRSFSGSSGKNSRLLTLASLSSVSSVNAEQRRGGSLNEYSSPDGSENEGSQVEKPRESENKTSNDHAAQVSMQSSSNSASTLADSQETTTTTTAAPPITTDAPTTTTTTTDAPTTTTTTTDAPTTTTTTTTSTTSKPEEIDEEGDRASLVFFIFCLILIAGLVLYGGGLCPRACPIFRRGDTSDNGTHRPLQYDIVDHNVFREDEDGSLVSGECYAPGLHRPSRLFQGDHLGLQLSRGGLASLDGMAIEMKEAPRIPGSGLGRSLNDDRRNTDEGHDSTDIFAHAAAGDHRPTIDDLFGSPAVPAPAAVTGAVPAMSANSMLLRKGKLGCCSPLPDVAEQERTSAPSPLPEVQAAPARGVHTSEAPVPSRRQTADGWGWSDDDY